MHKAVPVEITHVISNHRHELFTVNNIEVGVVVIAFWVWDGVDVFI